MSERLTTQAAKYSAEAIDAESTQIDGYEARNGDDVIVALRFKREEIEGALKQADMYTLDKGQDGDQAGATDGDQEHAGVAEDDQENTEMSENTTQKTGDGWIAQKTDGSWTYTMDQTWENLTHNGLQTAVNGEYWPESPTAENLADAYAEQLNGGKTTDEQDTSEQDENDTPASGGSEEEQNDDQDTTPASGWSVSQIEGRAMYEFESGETMRYTTLSSEVSDMDVEWPEDTTGENLANIYAEGQSDGKSTDQESDEETTPASGGSEEDDLIARGVAPDDLKTAKKFRDHNGECSTPNCPYGANKDSEECFRCAKNDWDQRPDSTLYEGSSDTTEGGSDRGSRVQKVAKSFGVSQKVAEKAVGMVEDQMASTELEALEAINEL